MNKIHTLIARVSGYFSVDTTFNTLAVISFLAIASWNWDAWWHVAVGFETPWSPPHILVFVDIFALAFGSLVLYYNTEKIVFKRVFIFSCITIASGSIDVVWHLLFGIEKIIQPSIVWSPPHIIGIGSNAIGLLCLLYGQIKTHQRQPNPLVFFRIVMFAISA